VWSLPSEMCVTRGSDWPTFDSKRSALAVALRAQSPTEFLASRAMVDPPAATISPSPRARTTPVDFSNRRSRTPPAQGQDDPTPVGAPGASRPPAEAAPRYRLRLVLLP
jgi:hypothetical protein